MRKTSNVERLGYLVGVLIAVLGFMAIGAWIFKFLWNEVAPLFWAEAPIFTFWHAFAVIGLIIFIRNLIFGVK